MSLKATRTTKNVVSLSDRAILLDLSEELAEYLTTVSKRLAPVLGGKDEDYEGFCFIGRDEKTQKMRAHMAMHTPGARLSTTYMGRDAEDLERFVHAWANHTIINKVARVK